MKHYWINIDRCVDRKEFMEKQFAKYGIENIRVSAATPERIAGFDFIRHPQSENTDLEFACLVSHIWALEQGYASGDEYFCVMEDDVNMCKLDWGKMFGYIKEKELKSGETVDILQLYTNSHPFIIKMINEQVDGEKTFITKRIDGYPSTAYYLISRDGAKKLIDKFKLSDTKYDFSYSSWTAADNMLYSPVTTYMLTYPVVTTNIKCGSIIHPSHLTNHENANIIIRQIHKQMNLLDRFM